MKLSLIVALILLAVGVLFALIRAIKGPRIADRIMAINMIGSLTIAAISILAVGMKENWLLDVSLIYCMISFLAVVVLTEIHIVKKNELKEEEENRDEFK